MNRRRFLALASALAAAPATLLKPRQARAFPPPHPPGPATWRGVCHHCGTVQEVRDRIVDRSAPSRLPNGDPLWVELWQAECVDAAACRARRFAAVGDELDKAAAQLHFEGYPGLADEVRACKRRLEIT